MSLVGGAAEGEGQGSSDSKGAGGNDAHGQPQGNFQCLVDQLDNLYLFE